MVVGCEKVIQVELFHICEQRAAMEDRENFPIVAGDQAVVIIEIARLGGDTCSTIRDRFEMLTPKFG